jgi:hypothetical protein
MYTETNFDRRREGLRKENAFNDAGEFTGCEYVLERENVVIRACHPSLCYCALACLLRAPDSGNAYYEVNWNDGVIYLHAYTNKFYHHVVGGLRIDTRKGLVHVLSMDTSMRSTLTHFVRELETRTAIKITQTLGEERNDRI